MYSYSYPPTTISTTSQQQRRVHSYQYGPPDDDLAYYNLRQTLDSHSRYIYESERLTRIQVNERTPEMRKQELQCLFERVDAQEFKKRQERRLEDITNTHRLSTSQIGGMFRAHLGLFPIREREEVDVDPVKRDPKVYEETKLTPRNTIEGRILGDGQQKMEVGQLLVEEENELDKSIIFVPRNTPQSDTAGEGRGEEETETLKSKCTMV